MHTHWLEDNKTASRHSAQDSKEGLENVKYLNAQIDFNLMHSHLLLETHVRMRSI